MDILSIPVESSRGNSCILVISDYFTKWTEAFALQDHKAITVADVLVTEVFMRFGLPLVLHSDQGPEFRSDLMRELCELLEIKATHIIHSPYHPRSDGQVERFNRTLLLSKCCKHAQEEWDDLW